MAKRARGKSGARKPSSGASRKKKQPYKHPVPDANGILEVLQDRGVPLSLAALAKTFELRDEQDRKALQRQLKKMLAAGQLLKNRRDEYCLLAKLDALTGKVSGHPDGFGFLVPDDGGEDIYLPFHEMRALLDGDRVAVRLSGRGRNGRRKGAVVEILERGKTTVVGQFRREHGVAYVVEAAARSPHHFMVARGEAGGAENGQMVKLEIIEYPSERREAQGKVISVLGAPDDPGMLTTLAIESFGLRTGWSRAVNKAADQLGTSVRESHIKGRVDLRDTPLVTIDGADARDFDDAVFAEPSGDGWRLVVAIADVSHYVQSADAIDNEAHKRGTSTYFPDQVVPMLPEALSNGLCSLNPRVDRLCLVCDMQLTSGCKVSKSKFYKAVMRSHERLTYSEVAAVMEQRDAKERKRLAHVLPQLENLYEVYRGFARARKRRGALDLELPEVRITLDADHHIESVAPRHRNDAQRVIEECMITANVQAAKFLRRHRLATLYRVHPGPEEDRFEELRLMLQELGFKVAAEARKQPRALNKILAALSNRPDFPMLATAVLRSMSQAVYQPANEGHFGLALDAYTHFTSPIRRYPDLLVHRGITHILDGGKPGAFGYKLPAMELLGKNCSELERQAEAASRHVESRYKCIYIKEHVGSEFDGVVTGVTHFGLFIMLEDLFVEGLVHVTNLSNDYYHAEHGGLRLTGERSGASYGLGDQLRVRVTRVDVEEARIDLQLVDAEPPATGGGRKRGKKSRRR
ncbi:MAG: ribonuclease R [Gammaproteobacteria bacterium]|nr:ribonuclease R [Gammaproteobacteria bacterium]MDP6695457.1 ribonuclease R [Gammaproteobacteria bacterium]